ncbi:hypothetical protein P5V15_013867 [Pogonomyrmex californicus]
MKKLDTEMQIQDLYYLHQEEEQEPLMEELEPLVLGMKTRNTEKSEGKSVPFTKKELNEPLFYEHIFQAEIHNNPLEETDETDYTENLFNNSTENNIQQNSTLESEISNYEDAENYDELNSQNHNNSNSRIEIPPKLLQILDNLTENNSKINQGEVQENLMPESENEEKNCPKNQIFIDDYIEEKDTEEDNEEKFDEDEDNDSEQDIDKTYNEMTFDEISDTTERQIMTRGQKQSIINSRDKIFMQKESYLYLLTTDGKPCDDGSKTLQRRNLIPKIKEGKIGNIEIVKKGNKFHLIFICKNNINEKITKKTLHCLITKLQKVIKENSIKILNIAKTQEIDNIKWEEILN